MNEFCWLYSKKLLSLLLAGTLLVWFTLIPTSKVSSASLPDILITEIQTGSKQAAGQEQIKIYNTTSKTIDLSEFRIEYFSANPKSFTIASRKIALVGELAGNKSYLLTSKDYLVSKADLHYSPTLAASGGHLKLVSGPLTNPSVYDLVGWGSAKHPAGEAVKAPPAGKKIIRKKDKQGKYLYSNNNKADFIVEGEGVVSAKTKKTATLKSGAKRAVPVPKPSNSKQDYSGLKISELMPNPAKPLTDSEHEFVELHNSSSRSISLVGLKLSTGSKLNYSYTFKTGVMRPGQYQAFYVSKTRLILSNSEGQAQLLAPSGQVIDNSASYSKADDGLSFASDGSKWRWSARPTPNAKNLFSTDSEENTEQGSDQSAVLGSVDDVSESEDADKDDSEDESQSRPINSGIIAGVGGLGIVYGLYEYRTDIGNLFSRLRGNRSNRQKDRK